MLLMTMVFSRKAARISRPYKMPTWRHSIRSRRPPELFHSAFTTSPITIATLAFAPAAGQRIAAATFSN
jgi:hypothetical protein